MPSTVLYKGRERCFFVWPAMDFITFCIGLGLLWHQIYDFMVTAIVTVVITNEVTVLPPIFMYDMCRGYEFTTKEKKG